MVPWCCRDTAVRGAEPRAPPRLRHLHDALCCWLPPNTSRSGSGLVAVPEQAGILDPFPPVLPNPTCALRCYLQLSSPLPTVNSLSVGYLEKSMPRALEEQQLLLSPEEGNVGHPGTGDGHLPGQVSRNRALLAALGEQQGVPLRSVHSGCV